MIYPGLYTRSGFNLMEVLVRLLPLWRLSLFPSNSNYSVVSRRH